MVRKVIDPRVSLFVRVGRRRERLRLNFDDDDVAKEKRKRKFIGWIFILLGTGSEGLWDLGGFVIVGNGMGSSMPVFEDTCIREWERRSSPPRNFQIAEQYYLDVRKDIVLGTLFHKSRINSTTCSVQQGGHRLLPISTDSVTEGAGVK